MIQELWTTELGDEAKKKSGRLYGLSVSTFRDAGKVIGPDALLGVIRAFKSKPAAKITSPVGLFLSMLAEAIEDQDKRAHYAELGQRASAAADKRANVNATPEARAKALYDAWTDDMRAAFCASLNGHLKPAPRAAFERRAFTDDSLRRACVHAIIEKGLV